MRDSLEPVIIYRCLNSDINSLLDNIASKNKVNIFKKYLLTFLHFLLKFLQRQ